MVEHVLGKNEVSGSIPDIGSTQVPCYHFLMMNASGQGSGGNPLPEQAQQAQAQLAAMAANLDSNKNSLRDTLKESNDVFNAIKIQVLKKQLGAE